MNPIGFVKEFLTGKNEDAPCEESARAGAAVPSVVRVKFCASGRELDYFNDRFDLRIGDLVFVSGKLAGQRGRVIAVSRHFKIRADDYQRVISLADTRVSGQFVNAASHLVTFDRRALSYSRFRTWVLPPVDDDDEYFISYDDDRIDLSGRDAWPFKPDIAERGADYYRDNRVPYLCLDGNRGRAIVDGSHPYEVEFDYAGGIVTNLACGCPCGYHCTHEFAALLQLRETLELIDKRCADDWPRGGYFAAVLAPLFFSIVVEGNSRTVLNVSQAGR